MRKIIYPIATLSGTIIGVGLFALPYVASKVGMGIMGAWFGILGTLAAVIHLLYAEIVLKTPDYKRFPGIVKRYLGKRGEKLAYITTIGGLFGAILSYLIVGGGFLTQLFQPYFGRGETFYGLIYFISGAILIYFGIRIIAQIEFLALILLLLTMGGIFIRGLPHLKITNLFPSPNISYLFLPYGVILFSLWGAALIPEVEEMLKKEKKLLKRVVLISLLFSLFVYLLFTVGVLGITGNKTTPSALSGLREYLGDGIVILVLSLGVLTTFTSFISLGLTLRRVLTYDLGISEKKAWAITCFAPFFIYFWGINNFVVLISFLGAVFLGIDGILILLIYKKIAPQKTKIILFLITLLIIGVIYEIRGLFI